MSGPPWPGRYTFALWSIRAWYGEGAKFTVTWLLGDWTATPVDPAGRGPYGQRQRTARAAPRRN